MKVLERAIKSLPAALGLEPSLAMASMQFSEFRGVPEQLADRGLSIDCDWTWGSLILIVVVVAFWAYHFKDRS